MKTYILHSDLNWMKFDLNLGILIDTKIGQYYTFDSINTYRYCISGFFHPVEGSKYFKDRNKPVDVVFSLDNNDK